MNKYLYKKIEQAHGAYIENLIFIANEVCRGRTSEAMEEFESLELSEICKVLGWRDEKDLHDIMTTELEEGGLSSMLLRNDVTGFIAECHMPECDNFRFQKGKTRPTSWSVHGGICDVFWIYADSIGELVDKLEKETEKRFVEMYEKFLSEPAAK
jgi:hypothetical protein